MDQIKWCLTQKNGIELVDPSENLRIAYIKKAEDSLAVIGIPVSRDWKLITAYYTIYQGIYSLLVKIGIKCEIHSCTIAFAKRFLDKYISKEDFILIDKAFLARQNSQYYVDRTVSDQDYAFILSKTPRFLIKCKNMIIEQNEIKKIREEIKLIQGGK